MDAKYLEMIDNDLKGYGLSTTFFTDEQKELIMQPDHAPENFMCDGEIDFKTAKLQWEQKLLNSGLKHPVVANVSNTIFGLGF